MSYADLVSENPPPCSFECGQRSDNGDVWYCSRVCQLYSEPRNPSANFAEWQRRTAEWEQHALEPYLAKREIRADAIAFLRSQPTDLVWVPCTFCGVDSLVEASLFVIEQAKAGKCVLGDVCDDCKARTPA